MKDSFQQITFQIHHDHPRRYKLKFIGSQAVQREIDQFLLIHTLTSNTITVTFQRGDSDSTKSRRKS